MLITTILLGSALIILLGICIFLNDGRAERRKRLEEYHRALSSMNAELERKELDIIEILDNPTGITAKKYQAQKAIRAGRKSLSKLKNDDSF